MDKDVLDDLMHYTRDQSFALGFGFGMIFITTIEILLAFAILCVKYNAEICH